MNRRVRADVSRTRLRAPPALPPAAPPAMSIWRSIDCFVRGDEWDGGGDGVEDDTSGGRGRGLVGADVGGRTRLVALSFTPASAVWGKPLAVVKEGSRIV